MLFTLEMLFEGANSLSLLCILMALTHCGVVGMSVYWVIMFLHTLLFTMSEHAKMVLVHVCSLCGVQLQAVNQLVAKLQ